MRFTTTKLPQATARGPVSVGNVYPAKGDLGNTRYWIVMSINAHGYASVLGIDDDGNVVSGQTYRAWAFEDRPMLGHCAGLAELRFEIEWRA